MPMSGRLSQLILFFKPPLWLIIGGLSFGFSMVLAGVYTFENHYGSHDGRLLALILMGLGVASLTSVGCRMFAYSRIRKL